VVVVLVLTRDCVCSLSHVFVSVYWIVSLSGREADSRSESTTISRERARDGYYIDRYSVFDLEYYNTLGIIVSIFIVSVIEPERIDRVHESDLDDDGEHQRHHDHHHDHHHDDDASDSIVECSCISNHRRIDIITYDIIKSQPTIDLDCGGGFVVVVGVVVGVQAAASDLDLRGIDHELPPADQPAQRPPRHTNTHTNTNNHLVILLNNHTNYISGIGRIIHLLSRAVSLKHEQQHQQQQRLISLDLDFGLLGR